MTQRKSKKPLVARKTVRVTLGDHERSVIGGRLLERPNGDRRQKMLVTIERLLTQLASEQANTRNVLYRSDLIAEYATAGKAADTLVKAMEAMHSAAADFIEVHIGMRREVMIAKLTGIAQLAEWVRSEPSKKGGERTSYEKMLRSHWRKTLGDFFDILWKQLHGEARKPAGHASRRRTFVTLSIAAIEQAIEAVKP